MVCNEPLLYWYCKTPELIENYSEAMADTEQTWDCHHRRELFANGNTLSVKALKHFGLYYNVPPEDLILLPHSEHMKLHKSYEDQHYKRTGRKHTPETREKMRKAALGHKVSEQCREKLRKFHTGLKATDEARRHMSEAQLRRHSNVNNTCS